MIRRNEELIEGIRELVQPWLDELRRTITSNLTVNEQGAHRYSLPAAASPTGAKATLSANDLMGYSLRETTGAAAAVVVLRDGDSVDADIVVSVSLAAGESARDWFAGRGIALVNGLYVDRVSGSTEGAVFLRRGGTS